MLSGHQLDLNGPTAYLCAQSGCQVCLERLLRHHQGLIHAVVRQQWCSGVAYADLVQEGRIALWQPVLWPGTGAILRYDPGRGFAFSTYAWVAIQRRIWRVVALAQRPHGCPVLAASPVAWHRELPDPVAHAEAQWQQAAVRVALREALSYLPERLRQVIIAVYGLDGEPPRSLAAVGRQYGVSRERVRQWRNDALVLLRLPALSARLRRLCEQDSRRAYVRAQALNRAWLRRRRACPFGRLSLSCGQAQGASSSRQARGGRP